MKNSIEKQTLKLGVIALVLSAIIPLLAQAILTDQAVPAFATVASVSSAFANS